MKSDVNGYFIDGKSMKREVSYVPNSTPSKILDPPWTAQFESNTYMKLQVLNY